MCVFDREIVCMSIYGVLMWVGFLIIVLVLLIFIKHNAAIGLGNPDTLSDQDSSFISLTHLSTDYPHSWPFTLASVPWKILISIVLPCIKSILFDSGYITVHNRK